MKLSGVGGGVCCTHDGIESHRLTSHRSIVPATLLSLILAIPLLHRHHIILNIPVCKLLLNPRIHAIFALCLFRLLLLTERLFLPITSSSWILLARVLITHLLARVESDLLLRLDITASHTCYPYTFIWTAA